MTIPASLSFSDLPPLLGDLAFACGTFVGVTTQPDGTHVVVVLLPYRAQKLTWKKAMAWAGKVGGELPTRPVAAMLFANAKDLLPTEWHWTCDEFDASYAWRCGFLGGDQSHDPKIYEGCAVAVRLIPLTS